jgi:hypothetical protein
VDDLDLDIGVVVLVVERRGVVVQEVGFIPQLHAIYVYTFVVICWMMVLYPHPNAPLISSAQQGFSSMTALRTSFALRSMRLSYLSGMSPWRLLPLHIADLLIDDNKVRPGALSWINSLTYVSCNTPGVTSLLSTLIKT